jgi:hypothetical protein
VVSFTLRRFTTQGKSPWYPFYRNSDNESFENMAEFKYLGSVVKTKVAYLKKLRAD